MDWSAVAIVLATALGPVLAVWASEYRQQRRAAHQRKEHVFQTLMVTRGVRLHADHVKAINQIDFAFPRSSCASVQDSWGLYRLHLRTTQSPVGTPEFSAWCTKSNELFADLLYQMALNLNVPFSKTEITGSSYHPDAYYVDELQQLEARKLLLEILKNERSVSITIKQ